MDAALERPALWQSLLGAVGVLLLGGGAVVVAYAITIIATRPLLFIVGAPFAIFGLMLGGAGLLCILPWLRQRRHRRGRSP